VADSGRLEAALLGSPLGPRLSAWRARYQEREFQRALLRRRQRWVVADVLHRVLVGRPATRAELVQLRRQAELGTPLAELAAELRRTVEGSRVTVDATNPALRTWLRSQFEPDTTEFATPRLVFLHGVKVGGTSLSDQFARWFGPDRLRVHVYLDDIALTPPPVLANLRIIAGHIPFAGLSLIPGSFLTMAVLRDPVERTLSHFYNLKASHPHYREVSLAEFVDDEASSFSGNHQARYLAHDIDLANAWRTYSPEERIAAIGGDRYTENPLQVLFDLSPTGQTDEELLRHATENLGRIDLVGTTENLDGVARRAAELFGLPPAPVGHLNRSTPTGGRDIDAGIRRRIDERTAVDRELYDRARRRALRVT
jgi:hypothetical protein